MNTILKTIFFLVIWNGCGGIILILLDVLNKFNDFSFMNAIKIYRTYRVNYFGAALICIIYNLLCPIASIGYWFYKLCTFGRK